MKKELFDLAGRVALVTGSSRGLGRDFALALARAGAALVVTSRNREDCAETCELIRKEGAEAWAVALDVCDHASIERAVADALAHYGKIDILVSNAGTNKRKYTVDYTWEEYDEIVDTNLKGSFFVIQEVVRRSMLKNRYGRIITIGSANCLRPLSFCTPYAASRAGVMFMTKSMAGDWAQFGITVNCIGPGWFPTRQTRQAMEEGEWGQDVRRQTPAGRFGVSGDMDTAVVFFASEASGFVTGQFLMVDGGFSLGNLSTPDSVPESPYYK